MKVDEGSSTDEEGGLQRREGRGGEGSLIRIALGSVTGDSAEQWHGLRLLWHQLGRGGVHRAPQTQAYDVARPSHQPGRQHLPQIQFNEDGEWRDFAPNGIGLKAGPWVSFLEQYG